MPSSINLLDPSLGIQHVMDMPEPANLPRARELASNALNEPGLEELYAPGNAWQLVEQALCPDVGDGSMLNPEIFSGTLESCLRDLEGSSDPAVQAMLSEELTPLLQNGQLLQAYLGLMIGG
ncbi:type III secretion protein [Mailhella massiliensis]|uniref:Type III secretion protein n=1 Tax=Mailhella massiliensis TaxID=1903261 RepID=A0A921DQM2_9BACT|nr:type III secretion protein [Mailhella massiliensis]HJD96695.1 type III secretion protein [Mailhella massiliensis]